MFFAEDMQKVKIQHWTFHFCFVHVSYSAALTAVYCPRKLSSYTSPFRCSSGMLWWQCVSDKFFILGCQPMSLIFHYWCAQVRKIVQGSPSLFQDLYKEPINKYASRDILHPPEVFSSDLKSRFKQVLRLHTYFSLHWEVYVVAMIIACNVIDSCPTIHCTCGCVHLKFSVQGKPLGSFQMNKILYWWACCGLSLAGWEDIHKVFIIEFTSCLCAATVSSANWNAVWLQRTWWAESQISCYIFLSRACFYLSSRIWVQVQIALM